MLTRLSSDPMVFWPCHCSAPEIVVEVHHATVDVMFEGEAPFDRMVVTGVGVVYRY